MELVVNEEPIESSGALSVFHAAVDELVRRYGGGSDDRQQLIAELTPPRGFFLVARDARHLAGGVGVRAIGDPGMHLGEVKRLWVRPDLRRTGIASTLMSAVLEHARARGYLRLYLETGPAQPEALAFYPRTGWTPIEEFPPGAYSHPGASRFFRDL